MADFNSDYTGVQIDSLLSSIPASMVVKIDGANAVAHNAATGAVVSTSSTHNVAIQAALDELTGSRTIKEKVVIIGDFTMSAQITIPSYTVLEIQGSLVKGTISDISYITNQDATNADIEIHGGHIDLDDAGGFKAGVQFDGVSGLWIDNMYITTPGKHCIDVKGCNDFKVTNNTTENNGDDGISILYSYDGIITGNTCIGGANNGSGGGSAGIEMEDGSHDITVTNNVVRDMQTTANDGWGIKVVTDSGGTGAPYNITIANNVINNCEDKGIHCNSAKSAIVISSLSGANGSGTVTFTLASAHSLVATHNDRVRLSGFTDTGLYELNGTWEATYVSATEFSISATVSSGYTGSSASVNFEIMNLAVIGNTIDNVGGAGVFFDNCRNATAADNVISNPAAEGFATSSGCYGVNVQNNTFYQAGTHGISCFENDVMNISGNNIVEPGAKRDNTYFGVLINTVNNSVVSNNTVVGLEDGQNRTKGMRDLSGTGNMIINNILSNCVTSFGGWIAGATGTIISGNTGHLTENAGIGSITSGGTTDVITHGLSDVPLASDIIITMTGATPTNANAADRIWITAIDATNFTVNCASDPGASNLDFSWKVVGPHVHV